jgi:hypothetical protein
MREYVVVPSSMVDHGTSLAGWIRRSLDYAASIPPKRAGRSKSPAAGSRGAKRGSTKAKRR